MQHQKIEPIFSVLFRQHEIDFAIFKKMVKTFIFDAGQAIKRQLEITFFE